MVDGFGQGDASSEVGEEFLVAVCAEGGEVCEWVPEASFFNESAEDHGVGSLMDALVEEGTWPPDAEP